MESAPDREPPALYLAYATAQLCRNTDGDRVGSDLAYAGPIAHAETIVPHRISQMQGANPIENHINRAAHRRVCRSPSVQTTYQHAL